MKNKIEPWSFQFEVVEGCNMSCAWCGIHSIRGKTKEPFSTYRYMPLELFKSLAVQIHEWRPTARIEFDNHGEPTLHPQWFEILKTARELLPKHSLQLQTNMVVANKKKNMLLYIKKHFDLGLNIFMANAYKQSIRSRIVKYIDSGEFKRVMPDVTVVDFYNYKGDNRPSAYSNQYGKKLFFLMDDLDRVNERLGKKNSSKVIWNCAGGTPEKHSPKLKEPLNKPCSRPFREMTFGYNGVVAICCYDFKNSFIFGDASVTPIKEMWESEPWQVVRRLLSRKSKNRNFSPCDVCDNNGGFRIGLLPNIRGISMEEAEPILWKHMNKFRHLQYKGYNYRIGTKTKKL